MMELDFATMLEVTMLARIGKDLVGTGLVPLLDHQKYQKTLCTGIIVMQSQQAGSTAHIQQYLERLFKGKFVLI